jgi:hypothetical protein
MTTIHDRQEALNTWYARHFTDARSSIGHADDLDNFPDRAVPESNRELTDEEIICRAGAAKNGDKFRRLWDGDTSGYTSPSEADLALCSHLAFWCGRDSARIDTLFRQSGLMRPKWDEKHFADGRTYGAGTIDTSLQGSRAFYSCGHATSVPHNLGSLKLHIASARRTPSNKLVVTVNVSKDGKAIDQLTINNNPSGRKQAETALAVHLDPNDKASRLSIPVLLAQLFTAGAAIADRPRTQTGATVREVVRQNIADFGLAFRTDGGAWSEKRSCEIRRADFVTHTSSSLMDAASEVDDAPRNDKGDVNRLQLLKVIKGELEVLWADLMQSLPVASGATLGQSTAAGQRFWSAMVRLWTTTGTWEKVSEGEARRASLISRAESTISTGTFNNASGHSRNFKPINRWWRIIDACSAWVRTHVDDHGELQVYLALRWELTHQIRVDLPGVSNQTSLMQLGVQFGVLDPNPPVPTSLGHGGSRLAVLSRTMTQQLRSAVQEDAGVVPDPRELLAPENQQSVPNVDDLTKKDSVRHQAAGDIPQANAHRQHIPSALRDWAADFLRDHSPGGAGDKRV